MIPSYNSESNIAICLASLVAQTYPHSKYEIIVVDSGRDRVPELCKEFNATCRRTETRLTQGQARNLGAELAKGDVLAFLDTDNKVPGDWLHRIVTDLKEYPTAYGVVSQITGGTTSFTKWLNHEYEHVSIQSKTVAQLEMSVEWGIALRKTVFEEGCRFHESPQYEGFSLFQCMKKRNMPILIDHSLRVTHLREVPIRSWVKRQFSLGRSFQAVQVGSNPKGVLVSAWLLFALCATPFYQVLPFNVLPILFLCGTFAAYEIRNKTLKNPGAPFILKIGFTAIGVVSKLIFWIGYAYQLVARKPLPHYR